MAVHSVEKLGLNVERSGRGRPLVMLHGFTGDASAWDFIRPQLDDRYEVLAVDLVGHGKSDAPQDAERYAMDRAVDDLVALVRSLTSEPALYLGYSLGGRVALQVAARHPGDVAALILEGATPGLAEQAEREARVQSDETLAARIEQEGLEWFADYWQSLSLWDSQRDRLSAEQLAALRAQRTSQRPHGLANSLRGMGTGAQRPVHDRLADLDMPALLIAGALDVKFSAIGAEMAAVIPGAEFTLIDDAGHAAHLEQPEAFTSLVSGFLEREYPADA